MSEQSQAAEESEIAESAKTESAYWQESVRLAELRMTEQSALQNEYDRKAVLMITFCVVLIGYLFVGEWEGWLAAKLAPIVMLSWAACRGMQILQFAEFGVQGIEPDISIYFADRATNEFEEHVLQEYAEKIGRNQTSLARQRGYLEKGRAWLYRGIAAAFIVSVLEKIAPSIVKWAAMLGGL